VFTTLSDQSVFDNGDTLTDKLTCLTAWEKFPPVCRWFVWVARYQLESAEIYLLWRSPTTIKSWIYWSDRQRKLSF